MIIIIVQTLNQTSSLYVGTDTMDAIAMPNFSSLAFYCTKPCFSNTKTIQFLFWSFVYIYIYIGITETKQCNYFETSVIFSGYHNQCQVLTSYSVHRRSSDIILSTLQNTILYLCFALDKIQRIEIEFREAQRIASHQSLVSSSGEAMRWCRPRKHYDLRLI